MTSPIHDHGFVEGTFALLVAGRTLDEYAGLTMEQSPASAPSPASFASGRGCRSLSRWAAIRTSTRRRRRRPCTRAWRTRRERGSLRHSGRGPGVGADTAPRPGLERVRRGPERLAVATAVGGVHVGRGRGAAARLVLRILAGVVPARSARIGATRIEIDARLMRPAVAVHPARARRCRTIASAEQQQEQHRPGSHAPFYPAAAHRVDRILLPPALPYG